MFNSIKDALKDFSTAGRMMLLLSLTIIVYFPKEGLMQEIVSFYGLFICFLFVGVSFCCFLFYFNFLFHVNLWDEKHNNTPKTTDFIGIALIVWAICIFMTQIQNISNLKEGLLLHFPQFILPLTIFYAGKTAVDF